MCRTTSRRLCRRGKIWSLHVTRRQHIHARQRHKPQRPPCSQRHLHVTIAQLRRDGLGRRRRLTRGGLAAGPRTHVRPRRHEPRSEQAPMRLCELHSDRGLPCVRRLARSSSAGRGGVRCATWIPREALDEVREELLGGGGGECGGDGAKEARRGEADVGVDVRQEGAEPGEAGGDVRGGCGRVDVRDRKELSQRD